MSNYAIKLTRDEFQTLAQLANMHDLAATYAKFVAGVATQGGWAAGGQQVVVTLDDDDLTALYQARGACITTRCGCSDVKSIGDYAYTKTRQHAGAYRVIE